MASLAHADRSTRRCCRVLAGHLADFKAYLAAKGKTAKHVAQNFTRCTAVLEGCEFTTLAALNSVLLAQWLAGERVAGRIGPKTSNYDLRDFKAFLRWMGRHGRMPEDHPCLDVEPVDTGQDVGRARRELIPAELLAVLAAVKASGSTGWTARPATTST